MSISSDFLFKLYECDTQHTCIPGKRRR